MRDAPGQPWVPAREMLTRACFSSEASGRYITDKISKLSFRVSKERVKHLISYPALQVQEQSGNLAMLRIGCPLDGSSCFWHIRPFQDRGANSP